MVKRAAGLASMLLGLAIIAWYVRHSTAALEGIGNPFVLVLPVAMVFLGWRWLANRPLGEDE